jgi:hypothetical protein
MVTLIVCSSIHSGASEFYALYADLGATGGTQNGATALLQRQIADQLISHPDAKAAFLANYELLVDATGVGKWTHKQTGLVHPTLKDDVMVGEVEY